MWKTYKKVGEKLFDFTDLCGALKLRSTSDEISEELNFKVKGTDIIEGDIILVYKDAKKIFEGIVVTVEVSEFLKSVTVYDFGWYLNKNESAYQFNGTISECIARICKDFGIAVGKIEPISIRYKKINRGNISDLISKLIDYATKNNGIEYIWQMRENKFYLEKKTDTVVVYNTAIFGQNIDITKLMSEATLTRSIEKMYNAIRVVGQEDNKINSLAYKEDAASIKKYGKIQKLEEVTKEEKGSAINIATNQLKLLNKVQKKLPVTLIGVIECRANKVLEFDDPVLGAKGKFEVKKCTHNITPTTHTMELELEVI